MCTIPHRRRQRDRHYFPLRPRCGWVRQLRHPLSVSDACYFARKPLCLRPSAVRRLSHDVEAAREGPDGKPCPSYRCIFPEAPPPGTVANCAEVGVLGAAVGVIGTLRRPSAEGDRRHRRVAGGRLLLYDAPATRFTEIKVAWARPIPLGHGASIRDSPVIARALPAAPFARLALGGRGGDPGHPVRQGRDDH